MEHQRDIANTEREKVITDCVGLKKKLEAMMLQRQKDAKDLSAMRHLKEKAFQVSESKRDLLHNSSYMAFVTCDICIPVELLYLF